MCEPLQSTCFKCGVLVTQVREWETERPNDGGLWFESPGGWPSPVWDPLAVGHDARLCVFICEACIKKHAAEFTVLVFDSVWTVRETRMGMMEEYLAPDGPAHKELDARRRCRDKETGGICRGKVTVLGRVESGTSHHGRLRAIADTAAARDAETRGEKGGKTGG